MRLAFYDLLKIMGITLNLLKQWRLRDQVALAFGRDQMWHSLGYLPIDAVATVLCDLLAEQLDRTQAAHAVRSAWGVWMRVAAQAEAAPDKSAFWYVCTFIDKRGKTGHLTLGSLLDPDQPGALHAIATDIRARTGVALQKYVAADMTAVLQKTREQAAKAGYDLSAPFLPPFGDDRLEELLKPYDDAMPDRAVITGPIAKAAARAGAQARKAAVKMASTAVH